MRTYSFYRNDNGAILKRRARGPFNKPPRAPAGCTAIEGEHDHLSQRVDLETGAVVPYVRPAAELEAEQRAARARQARQRIDALEREQHRALREIVLTGDEKSRERLAAIDAEIARLRS